MSTPRRLPSLRKRYVTRAAYLKEDRRFLTAVEDAIAGWNDRFPAYAIRHRGTPPDPLPTADPNGEFVRVVHPGIERDLYADSLDVQASAEAAQTTWRETVRALCEEWWPAEYYPRWAGAEYRHTAGDFVASCLLWNPVTLQPEDAIPKISATLLTPPFDPYAPPEDWHTPNQAYWETRYRELAARLEAAAESGETIIPMMLAAFEQAALSAAVLARHEAYQRRPHGVVLVPIPRGMNGVDWRELGAWVLLQTDDKLDEQVRRLVDQGHSHLETARLLGLSRYAVTRMLSSE